MEIPFFRSEAMKLEQLKTPAFLIDLTRLENNIQKMEGIARSHGIHLRPHIKTHKTVEIARMQTEGRIPAIAVSTLAEARFFGKEGFLDITYAFPLTKNKIEEAAALTRILSGFHILVDHPDLVEALQAYGQAHSVRFSVYLKVNPGYHRAGVDPQKKESVELARRIHEGEGTQFEGVLTHGGHAYDARDPAGVKRVAREERSALINFAAAVEGIGAPCPVLSAGSTPTAVHGENWKGVTELRPGNYVFFDKFQADIGTCTLDECAATVLAEVAGHYPDRNQMLIDAGALALSKDRGADHVLDEVTYGAVQGRPELKITKLSQEHGIVESDAPICYHDFPLGSRLRIVPNHSCLAAALFPRYAVVIDDTVVDEWYPARGW